MATLRPDGEAKPSYTAPHVPFPTTSPRLYVVAPDGGMIPGYTRKARQPDRGQLGRRAGVEPSEYLLGDLDGRVAHGRREGDCGDSMGGPAKLKDQRTERPSPPPGDRSKSSQGGALGAERWGQVLQLRGRYRRVTEDGAGGEECTLVDAGGWMEGPL
jgi:hypothetical protein